MVTYLYTSSITQREDVRIISVCEYLYGLVLTHTAPPYLLFANYQHIQYLTINNSELGEILTYSYSYALDFDLRLVTTH